jgi:hypothetical protein
MFCAGIFVWLKDSPEQYYWVILPYILVETLKLHTCRVRDERTMGGGGASFQNIMATIILV